MKDSTTTILAGCIFMLSMIVFVLALNLGLAFGLALVVHLAFSGVSVLQAFVAFLVLGVLIGLLTSALKPR